MHDPLRNETAESMLAVKFGGRTRKEDTLAKSSLSLLVKVVLVRGRTELADCLKTGECSWVFSVMQNSL